MLRIGLTGGIGSGKSLVAGIFSMLGIPVFFADAEAATITSGPEVIDGLKKLFGPGILLPDGKPDKKKMRELIFNDANARDQVNRLIHPLVRARFDDWCNQQADVPFILEEAAILYESGANKNVDMVIAVTAPEAIRLSRVVKRDGVNEEHVKQIMATQMKEEDKVSRADFVIVNDEVQAVLPQVLDIYNRLVKTDTTHAGNV